MLVLLALIFCLMGATYPDTVSIITKVQLVKDVKQVLEISQSARQSSTIIEIVSGASLNVSMLHNFQI